MVKDELIKELKVSGAKFTEKDIAFITRDTKGRIVWLERGDDKAGLRHIILRHAKDFENAVGVSAVEIPELLKKVINDGILISDKPSKNVVDGFDRVYDYKGNYFVFMGIGGNGFIVTAFPVPKEV